MGVSLSDNAHSDIWFQHSFKVSHGLDSRDQVNRSSLGLDLSNAYSDILFQHSFKASASLVCLGLQFSLFFLGQLCLIGKDT